PLAILSAPTPTVTIAAESTFQPDVIATTPTPTRTPGRSIPTPTPAPTATPTPLPPTPTPEPPANRLVVSAVGIRAVVEVKGLDANMVMQVPDDPFQVAWYDFTSNPGTPGNTVFAGHVDHETVGRAAFWTLRNVKIGEIVEYHSIDGQQFRYRVSRIITRSANDPANDLVAQTDVETITLITCAGGFDRRARAYDQRLIVQAVRELP
ncbi:MAG: class F sortase, partial [Vicinamibacterales bacterium]